jgi:hypothetical protein
VADSVTDLSERPGLSIQDYDPFLILDVIEGLKDPQALLDGLLAQLDDALHPLIITTPNIASCAENHAAVRAVARQTNGHPGPPVGDCSRSERGDPWCATQTSRSRS